MSSDFKCFQTKITSQLSLYISSVHSIILEDSKISGFVSSKTLQKCRPPINVTIISSDISLFCDTNEDSHKIAFKAFIDRMSPYFDQAILKSIHIVVATSAGELALRNQVYDGTVVKAADDDESNVQNQNEAMNKCVRMIQLTIDDLLNVFHSSTNDSVDTSIAMKFSLIRNASPDFIVLSHDMVRELHLGSNVRLSCRLRNIDLPALNDGSHCSISLEASYQMFPFSISSVQATMLSNDLDHLSMLNFNVVQLIPLSSIDVGLLFGIPIVVRAGMNDDYTQFQQMKVIVRSLFRILQTQEQAILLRGSSNNNVRLATTKSNGLFHSDLTCSGMEHYFVLMAQEIPCTLLNNADSVVSPSSGVLFRIAHVDRLLYDKATLDSKCGHCVGNTDDNERESEMQYLEFIESSLSMLNFSSFNPFLPSSPTDEENSGASETQSCMEGDSDDKVIAQEVYTPVNSLTLPIESSFVKVTPTSDEMERSNNVNTTTMSIYDLNSNEDDVFDVTMVD
jgi:hypothetical protein